MPTDSKVRTLEFHSLDGLLLRGTLVEPSGAAGIPTVLVHGGGVTRDEGGFFTRFADALARTGSPALRFDFRAHGESEGNPQELTLAGVANDIHAAIAFMCQLYGTRRANLVGASFGGGISALFAARHPDLVHRLTLFNPLLDYKKRFIDDKPAWHEGRISDTAGRDLADRGYLAHSPTFRLGRALLNEVFYLNPIDALPGIAAPTLFVHGTKDTFVPVQSSRAAVTRITRARADLIEIDGAQHGFAVHDDPGYQQPQTQEWQAFVIESTAAWLTGPA